MSRGTYSENSTKVKLVSSSRIGQLSSSSWGNEIFDRWSHPLLVKISFTRWKGCNFNGHASFELAPYLIKSHLALSRWRFDAVDCALWNRFAAFLLMAISEAWISVGQHIGTTKMAYSTSSAFSSYPSNGTVTLVVSDNLVDLVGLGTLPFRAIAFSAAP